MNQPECFTTLDIVRPALIGKHVVISLRRELLGKGVVDDVQVDGNVDGDWFVVKFIDQKEEVAVGWLDEAVFTILDP